MSKDHNSVTTDFSSKENNKENQCLNSENYFSKFKNYPSNPSMMLHQKSGATALLSQKPSIKESHLESNLSQKQEESIKNPYGKLVYPKDYNKMKISDVSSHSQLSERSLRNFFAQQLRVLKNDMITPKKLYEAAKQIFDIFDEERLSRIPLEKVKGLEQVMSEFFEVSKKSSSTENLANFDSFNPKNSSRYRELNIMADLEIEGNTLSKKDFELWILKYMCDNSNDLNLRIGEKIRSEMKKKYSHRRGFLGNGEHQHSSNSYIERPQMHYPQEYLEIPNQEKEGQNTGRSSADLEYSFNNTHDNTRYSHKTDNTILFDIQDENSYYSREQSYLDMNKYRTNNHSRKSKMSKERRESKKMVKNSRKMLQNQIQRNEQYQEMLEVETPEENITIIQEEIEEEECFQDSEIEADQRSYESGDSIVSEFLEEEESIVEEVKIEKTTTLFTGQGLTEVEKKMTTFTDFSNVKQIDGNVIKTCVSPNTYFKEYEKAFSSRDRRETAESYGNLIDACVSTLPKNTNIEVRMTKVLQERKIDHNKPKEIKKKERRKYSNKKTTDVEFLNELYDDYNPSSENTKKLSRIFNTEKENQTPEQISQKTPKAPHRKKTDEQIHKERRDSDESKAGTVNLTVAERSNHSNSSYFTSSPSQKEKLGKLARASNKPEPSSRNNLHAPKEFKGLDFNRQRGVIKFSRSNSRNLSASNQIFELSNDSYNPSKNVSNFELDLGDRRISKTDGEISKSQKKAKDKSGVKKLRISGEKWDDKSTKNLHDLKGNEFMTYDQVFKKDKKPQENQDQKTVVRNFDTKDTSQEIKSKNSEKNTRRNTLNQSQKSPKTHSFRKQDYQIENSACDCRMVYDSNDDHYSAFHCESGSIGKSSKKSLREKINKKIEEEERNVSMNTADFIGNSSKLINNSLINCSNVKIIPSKNSANNIMDDRLSFQVSFKNIRSQDTVQNVKKMVKSQVNPERKDVEKIEIDLKESTSTQKSKKSNTVYLDPESIQFRINYDRSRYYYKSHIPNSSYYDFNEGSTSNNIKSMEKSSNLFESISPNDILLKIHSQENSKSSKGRGVIFEDSLDSDEDRRRSSILERYKKKVELKYIKTREDVDIVKYGSKAEDLIRRGYSATPPLKGRNYSIEKRSKGSVEKDSKIIETRIIDVSSMKTNYGAENFELSMITDKENSKEISNITRIVKEIPDSKRVIYFNSREKDSKQGSLEGSIDMAQLSERNVRANLMGIFKESSIDSTRRNGNNSSNFIRDVSKVKENFLNNKGKFRDYRENSVDSKEYYRNKANVYNGSQTTRVYTRPQQSYQNPSTSNNVTPIKLQNNLLQQIPVSARVIKTSVERRITPVRTIIQPLQSQRGNITTRSIDSSRSYRITNNFPTTPVHNQNITCYTTRNVTPVRPFHIPVIKTIRKQSNEKCNGNFVLKPTGDYGSVSKSHTRHVSLGGPQYVPVNQTVTPIRNQVAYSSRDTQMSSRRQTHHTPVQRVTFTPNHFSSRPISNIEKLSPRKDQIIDQGNDQRREIPVKKNPLSNPINFQNDKNKTPQKIYTTATSSIETIKRSPINPKNPSHPSNSSNQRNNISGHSSNTNPLLAYMNTSNLNTENSHPIGNVFRTPISSFCEKKPSITPQKKRPVGMEKSQVVKQRILKRINRLLDKYDNGKAGYINVEMVGSIVKDIYSWLGVEDNISIKKDTQDYINGISVIEGRKGRGESVWSNDGFKRKNVEEYLLGRLNYCEN